MKNNSNFSYLLQAIEKRREYIRNEISKIDDNGREQQPKTLKSMRQGMLSELTTLECVIKGILEGEFNLSNAWNIQ